jgi:DNA primase large subunit
MGEYICPECRQPQTCPIENGLCVKCHDRFYREACERDDDASRSIVEEYRLTARSALGGIGESPG